MPHARKKIGYIMVTTKYVQLHTGYNQKIPFQIDFFPSLTMIATEIVFSTMCDVVWMNLELILIRILMSARQTLQLSPS